MTAIACGPGEINEQISDRLHTPDLAPASTPGHWRTYCRECSAAAGDYVPVCSGPGWAEQVPGELIAVPEPHADHIYLSTFCYHGTHKECGAAQLLRGDLSDPHCKGCEGRCICPRHTDPDAPCWGGDQERRHEPDCALDGDHLGWCGVEP